MGFEVKQLRLKSWLCRSRGLPWVVADFLTDSFSASLLSSPVTGSSLPIPSTPAASGPFSLTGRSFQFRPVLPQFHFTPEVHVTQNGLGGWSS